MPPQIAPRRTGAPCLPRHFLTPQVTPTGRFFTELMLDNLMKARYLGPTGPQD
jgi:hypothetical protein